MILVAWDDVKVNTKDDLDHGHSPLSYATEHGSEAVVEILLGRDDVEVDTRYEAGHMLLSYATH